MSANLGETWDLLAGHVAIVTGGGRGLGRAFARALANAGASVAVVARSTNEIADTAAAITTSGGRAIAIAGDVSDRQAVERMSEAVAQQLGPVTLLINNAGVAGPVGPFWEIDPDEWWRSTEINLRSAVLCSHAVLPGMVRRRQGRIVNVSSGAGTVPIPFASAYVTAKAAMIRLTETLASETGAHGVHIFAIHPGSQRTAMTEYLATSAEGRQWVPWIQEIFEEGGNAPVEDAVRLVLGLAAGRADLLSGRYLTVTDDLDALVQRAPEVAVDDLYALRVRSFR